MDKTFVDKTKRIKHLLEQGFTNANYNTIKR